MSEWSNWNEALTTAGIAATVADAHGSISGYLCAGWNGQPAAVLAALELECKPGGRVAPLHALIEQGAARFAASAASGTALAPLLPDADLPARADALVEWCRGFLGGLGLTGLAQIATSDPGLRHLLGAIEHIAAVPLACADDDEPTLAEILGFVGRAVTELRRALAPGRPT